jgi:hypothetical protein
VSTVRFEAALGVTIVVVLTFYVGALSSELALIAFR